MNLERCLQEGLIKRDHKARDRVENWLLANFHG